MEIIGKCIILRNIKERISMSNTLKIQDWVMNSFNAELYRMQIIDMETHELEFLVDVYTHITPKEFKEQIELITAELAFRKSPLGKELY
jgi:hypothetical protein